MKMIGQLNASAALTAIALKEEAEFTPQPVRTFWRREKSLFLTG
jgi:hypothetical protein